MPAATVLRGHNVRTRKLNPRASLPIIREQDLDGLDDDAQRNVPVLETGIEKHEETVSLILFILHQFLGTLLFFVVMFLFCANLLVISGLLFFNKILGKQSIFSTTKNQTLRYSSEYATQLKS